jgi:hypothetical protein
VILSFSQYFLLTTSLWRQRMSTHISLFTVGISVNYTNEFGKPFEPLNKNANQNVFLAKLCYRLENAKNFSWNSRVKLKTHIC